MITTFIIENLSLKKQILSDIGVQIEPLSLGDNLIPSKTIEELYKSLSLSTRLKSKEVQVHTEDESGKKRFNDMGALITYLINFSDSDDLTEAKDYTDQQVLIVNETVLEAAKVYTDDLVSSVSGITLNQSKSYTDSSVSGKEDVSNKDTDINLTANSDTRYPSQKAIRSFSLSMVGGMPMGVNITALNKSQVMLSKDGLIIEQYDSSTQVNTQGAFNGTGVGQKCFIELTNYDTNLLSTISLLSFNAKNYRDGGPSGQAGNMAFNLLVNFANGFLTAANDYAILVADGLPALFTQFFFFGTSYSNSTVLSSDRAFKCVGGTGVINFTGNTTIGSNEVTNVSGSNINALTVGMYVRKTPTGVTAAAEANMPFPDGSVINSIDVPGNKFTVYFNGSPANAAVNGTGTSFKQYGGVAPVSRSGTSNGAAQSVISGITNTLDLQVNMKVTGVGVPANTYITTIVPNTSITVSTLVPLGAVTLNFSATGKTGIPGSGELVGVPLSVVVSNNPNAFITNNAPMTPIWAAFDGGSPKNVTKMGGILLNTGSSGTLTHRMNAIASITVNSIVYKFVVS